MVPRARPKRRRKVPQQGRSALPGGQKRQLEEDQPSPIQREVQAGRATYPLPRHDDIYLGRAEDDVQVQMTGLARRTGDFAGN